MRQIMSEAETHLREMPAAESAANSDAAREARRAG
jgi:hypothetical protein